MASFTADFTAALPDFHLLRLTLSDSSGQALSENTYWRYRTPQAMRALNKARSTKLSTRLGKVTGADGRRQLTATIKNTGSAVAAMVRLSLVDQHGNRVLPTLYGDNYLWLLPGESRELTVSWPAQALTGTAVLQVAGYNTPVTTARP